MAYNIKKEEVTVYRLRQNKTSDGWADITILLHLLKWLPMNKNNDGKAFAEAGRCSAIGSRFFVHFNFEILWNI